MDHKFYLCKQIYGFYKEKFTLTEIAPVTKIRPVSPRYTSIPYIELGGWLCSQFQLETLNFQKPITHKLYNVER